MNSILPKITVCLIGGLLFLITGCRQNNTPPVSQQPAAVAATAIPTSPPAPTIPTAAPTATQPPIPTMTPTVGPMAIPTMAGLPFANHKIGAGETLGYIADSYDLPIEELVKLNKLSGADAIIQIDQSLRIPLADDMPQAPTEVVWPDSEVVYSPAYLDFDMAEFAKKQGGYLAQHTEMVDGEKLSGTEVIARVSERFSVGPRVLLTLLEHYGEWVTNPHPAEALINAPLGPRNPMGGSLYLAAAWTAKKINAGYYGYRRNGFWIHTLDDYKLVIAKTGLSAGTVGMQAILAVHSDTETWQKLNQPDGLMAEYKKLFGDPKKYALKGYVVPSNLTQPPMSLPWKKGQGFYLTAGPHAAYIEGSGWAAVDFGAPDVLGNCFISAEPNTAAADGLILTARPGEVELDLDGDGKIQTGWVLMYLHAALDSETPVQVGQHVKTGDVIGYASCEGGEANASHLHFVRRYNGEWMDADGPVPMNLSGWQFLPTTVEYDGKVQKGKVVRDSCECWKKDENLLVNEDK